MRRAAKKAPQRQGRRPAKAAARRPAKRGPRIDPLSREMIRAALDIVGRRRRFVAECQALGIGRESAVILWTKVAQGLGVSTTAAAALAPVTQ